MLEHNLFYDTVMTRTMIKRLFRNGFQQMKLHYDRMRSIKNEENIRHFRVGLKRLRAFLRLLSAESGEKIPLPDDLRRVYRKTGIVHDLQLRQQRLKEQTGIRDYSLEQKLAAAIKELDTAMEPLLLRHAWEKLEKKLPGRLSAKSIENFFYSNLAAISDVVGNRMVTDTGLHTARKRMKDLLYDGRLLDDTHPATAKLPGWNKRKEREYRKLSRALGNYRNDAVLLQQEDIVARSKLFKKHVADNKELARTLGKFIADNKTGRSLSTEKINGFKR